VAGHPVLGAASDAQVAVWAAEEGRRVVTENVRDFALLVGGGDPPLQVLFTSSRRLRRSRRNPGPLLKALRGWLNATSSIRSGANRSDIDNDRSRVCTRLLSFPHACRDSIGGTIVP
jgi:hypothetical protein